MVHLTKIYTRTGDEGETSLANNTRVSKTNSLMEAIGAVDEANSAIGMATEYRNEIIDTIQNDLFDIGAELAQSKQFTMSESKIKWLEDTIDDYNKHLEPLRSFVLPTGPLHNARTIVRRAERAVWMAAEDANGRTDLIFNPFITTYLNRLSDLLFVMARYHNKDNEKLWDIARN